MEAGAVERLAKLEGMVEVLIKQVSDLSNRLGTMEVRLESLESRIDNRLNLMETRLHAMEDRMASFVKWIIAALLGVWATIMGTLIAGLLLR